MRCVGRILLLLVITGCATVYNRPLADVSHAVDTLQPWMVAEVAPECREPTISTNQVPGESYGIHVGEKWPASLGGPYCSIQATNIGPNKTEVVVIRMTKGASIAYRQHKDFERAIKRALKECLEANP